MGTVDIDYMPIPMQKLIAGTLSGWKTRFGNENKPTARQLVAYANSTGGPKVRYSQVTKLFKAHLKPSRRRMAQREFSNRRDSPVMVKLLQEIIDAQDD